MNNCIVNKKSLNINGKEVNFLYEIDNVKKVNEIYVVLLDIPSNVQVVNNVYAVNNNGVIVWQIEDIRNVYPIQNDVPYVGTRVADKNQIIVTNFNGVTFVVDSSSGKIIKKGCTK